LIYVGGIVGPIVTIPQAIKIFMEHDAGGVSLFSWSMYFLGACAWFAYGLVHSERPIIFFNILNIPIYLAIVIGVVLYG
ncbi:MAG: PQ-loop domain-containing transporter, partial [Minisyncoccia bacterium]